MCVNLNEAYYDIKLNSTGDMEKPRAIIATAKTLSSTLLIDVRTSTSPVLREMGTNTWIDVADMPEGGFRSFAARPGEQQYQRRQQDRTRSPLQLRKRPRAPDSVQDEVRHLPAVRLLDTLIPYKCMKLGFLRSHKLEDL